VRVRRLAAVRRLRVAGDLDLEHVQARGVLRQEERVQDVVALRLRVVAQQARGGARREAAVAVVDVRDGAAVDGDGCGPRGGERGKERGGEPHRRRGRRVTAKVAKISLFSVSRS